MFNIYKNNALQHENVSWDDTMTTLKCTDDDILHALDGYQINGYEIDITTDLMESVAISSVIEIPESSDKIRHMAELLQISEDMIRKHLRSAAKKLELSGNSGKFIRSYQQIGELRKCRQ
jgi:hypothetical protein